MEIGYYDGRQSAKIWLISTSDIQHMYSVSKNGEVSLWVEYKGDSDDEEEAVVPAKKHCKSGTKKQTIEDEVESIYQELAKKHGSSSIYCNTQLRLWARLIQSGSHDDYEDPPRVPQITGMNSKPKKESLTEAITGAAVAVAKVFASSTQAAVNTATVASPGKCTDLRLKNLEQLRLLQLLKQDGVLSTEEFVEQKSIILEAIRKL